MRTETMDVDGDPDKSCSHTHGGGDTNWWIRIQGMSGIFVLSFFFCEFEIILKVFKTGSDKKESKDGMYRQHSGTRTWSWSKGKLCVWLRKGFLLKGRDITVCRIVMVVVLKPSSWCQRERSHSHILAFQIRNNFFYPSTFFHHPTWETILQHFSGHNYLFEHYGNESFLLLLYVFWWLYYKFKTLSYFNIPFRLSYFKYPFLPHTIHPCKIPLPCISPAPWTLPLPIAWCPASFPFLQLHVHIHMQLGGLF